MKSADDNNTDLPGKQESEQGSDDSDRKQTEGKEGKARQDKSKPSDEGKKSAKQSTDSADDDDSREDDRILTKTQSEFNRMMGDARKEGRKKAETEIADLKAKLEAVTTERDAFRTAEVEKVKTQFDALPDEVKAFAPTPLEKINEGGGFKAITEWLPKAAALAEKLKPAAGSGSKPLADKQVKEGLKPDPKPASKSTQEYDRALNAAKSDMSRRF